MSDDTLDDFGLDIGDEDEYDSYADLERREKEFAKQEKRQTIKSYIVAALAGLIVVSVGFIIAVGMMDEAAKKAAEDAKKDKSKVSMELPNDPSINTIKKDRKEPKMVVPPTNVIKQIRLFRFNEIITNLQTKKRRPPFVSLILAIEYKIDPETDDGKSLKLLEERAVEIENDLVIFLRGMKVDDLIGGAGTYRVKETAHEILSRTVGKQVEIGEILVLQLLLQ